MIEREIQVNSYFETRPAALLVQTASRYVSRISIQVGEKTANAKSIMGVISLGIEEGQTVTLIADGEDEKNAIPALEQFLRTRMAE